MIRLWDVNTGALLLILEGRKSRILSVVFSPDCQRLISASNDGTVRLWDINTGVLMRTFFIGGYSGNVTSVAFSSDGRYLVFARAHEEARLWYESTVGVRSIYNGSLSRIIESGLGLVWSVAFSPDRGIIDLASLSDEHLKTTKNPIITEVQSV